LEARCARQALPCLLQSTIQLQKQIRRLAGSERPDLGDVVG
jgi:hypothetical protein